MNSFTDPDDLTEMPGVTDPDTRRMLGLFDLPAFVRRGQDLDTLRSRFQQRLLAEREERLSMVRLRLRQWAAAAVSPIDGTDLFADPLAPLIAASGHHPIAWADNPASPRRRRLIASDLVASALRFNERWTRFLETLDLAPLNRQIELYNTYYVLEKECSLGSPRLAHRHFTPIPLYSLDSLSQSHPTLPVPRLRRP